MTPELEKYRTAEKSIEEAKHMMAQQIQNLLIKGFTFGEIAKALNKNSRQTVFGFYRTYLKKYESKRT